MCSSDSILDFNYSVLPDLHSSDHFPIKIIINQPAINIDQQPRFNIEKANWNLFKDLTMTEIEPDDYDNVDIMIANITDIIINAATAAIPRKGGTIRKPPVPWYNQDCRDSRRVKIRAERTLRRHYNVCNLIAYKKARAKCRYVCNESKKQSWKDFISSITEKMPLKKVWKRIAKLSGKFSPTPTPIIKLPGGSTVREPADVANCIADTFSQVSGDHNYSDHFLTHKRKIEKQKLSFYTRQNEYLTYNDPFTNIEFQSALSKSKESSPCEDQISYSMIKHLHPTMMDLLLKCFNRIFTEKSFPEIWRTAIIIPIKKPNKDQYDPINYRPISLTSCICKLLEKMVNDRLMWILEKENLITQIQSGFRKNRSHNRPYSTTSKRYSNSY